MDYSVQAAQHLIGKRVVVSLRHIDEAGNESYSGLWGVIDSADEDGLLLAVEGGSDEPYWGMPPDLTAFHPAQHAVYELGESGAVVTEVDLEAYWTIAPNIELLEQRDER
jgi:hypothetical protein